MAPYMNFDGVVSVFSDEKLARRSVLADSPEWFVTEVEVDEETRYPGWDAS